MTLTIHGVRLANIFRLYGLDENSASSALGWILEQSPNFRRLFIQLVFGEVLDADDVVISLQRHSTDGGYTDIEIVDGHRFHVILEAKRWWEVPSLKQLERYQPRLINGAADQKKLVSISAAEPKYAMRRLPPDVGGVEIVHLSWGMLQRLAQQARSEAARIEEKLWLRELIQHLQEVVVMERQNDNRVYVVSLGANPMVEGNPHTWIDVVEKDHRYFHPVGKSWPVTPPNYIGFRYQGKLQSVHHIDHFEVVENLASCNPNWPTTDSDHFVYRLGPAMSPPVDVKSGNIRNTRLWCAIDTLLSGGFDRISDARDETKRRLEETL